MARVRQHFQVAQCSFSCFFRLSFAIAIRIHNLDMISWPKQNGYIYIRIYPCLIFCIPSIGDLGIMVNGTTQKEKKKHPWPSLGTEQCLFCWRRRRFSELTKMCVKRVRGLLKWKWTINSLGSCFRVRLATPTA